MSKTNTRTQSIRNTPVGATFEFRTTAYWWRHNTERMARRNGVKVRVEQMTAKGEVIPYRYRCTILSREGQT